MSLTPEQAQSVIDEFVCDLHLVKDKVSINQCVSISGGKTFHLIFAGNKVMLSYSFGTNGFKPRVYIHYGFGTDCYTMEETLRKRLRKVLESQLADLDE
jgi:hypothetical protein